jgi:hypothetical protein
LKVEKSSKDTKVANQLISMWFGSDTVGKFGTKFLYNRGSYNASAYDAALNSTNTELKNQFIKKTSADLIENSFVMFTNLNFYENEPVARMVRDLAIQQTEKSMATSPPFLKQKAMDGIETMYQKTKEGYTTISKTFLYKLRWNDSILNIFYSTMYEDYNKFQSSDLFQLEFVGSQLNSSVSTFKIGVKQTKGELIKKSLYRNLENTFTKLQKKNEVFRPFVQISTVEPITAPIGMKEGLEGGESFSVFALNLKGIYEQIGVIKVDKNSIWDNRYKLDGEAPENVVLNASGVPISSTLFKGSIKGAQPGFLIKFLKD